MRRKDEFAEIAEWLVFNCGKVHEAVESGDDDALADAISGVLREENIGYRDSATSEVVASNVQSEVAGSVVGATSRRDCNPVGKESSDE